MTNSSQRYSLDQRLTASCNSNDISSRRHSVIDYKWRAVIEIRGPNALSIEREQLDTDLGTGGYENRSASDICR